MRHTGSHDEEARRPASYAQEDGSKSTLRLDTQKRLVKGIKGLFTYSTEYTRYISSRSFTLGAARLTLFGYEAELRSRTREHVRGA